MLLILQVYCKYILIIRTCTKSAGPMQKHLYQNFIQQNQSNVMPCFFLGSFQFGCNTDHHSRHPDSSFMQFFFFTMSCTSAPARHFQQVSQIMLNPLWGRGRKERKGQICHNSHRLLALLQNKGVQDRFMIMTSSRTSATEVEVQFLKGSDGKVQKC